MRFEKIGVLLTDFRDGLTSSVARKPGRTDERSNIGRQCGRRVPARFFPALLLSDRPMANEKGGGLQDHWVRVEILKYVFPLKLPGENDGKGDFVQLNSLPVRLAVHPEILSKAAILLL